MATPTTVSLYEAKTHLSALGERAAAGEEIVVTKHGQPRFRIVQVEQSVPRPGPGSLAAQLSRAQATALEEHDWFAPDEGLERDFGTRE